MSGFSDLAYEPVASTLFGLRFFLVDCDEEPVLTNSLVGSGGKMLATTPASPSMEPTDHRFGTAGTLRSMFHREYLWAPGANQAVCLNTHPRTFPSTHTICHPACGCGFWAYRRPQADCPVGGQQPARLAVGVIEGWGKTLVGPLGFRCEYAAIRALAFPTYLLRLGRWLRAKLDGAKPETYLPKRFENTPSELIELIAIHYPDAMLFGTVADMVQVFPLTDTAALLPPQLPEPEPDAAA